MEKLQEKLNKNLADLRALRMDKDFQKLPEYQRLKYTKALKELNDIEDYIIINHILTNK
jgi:hypothetical protein